MENNLLKKLNTLYDKQHNLWKDFDNVYTEFTPIHNESYNGLMEELDKHEKIPEDKKRKRSKNLKKLYYLRDVDDFISDIWSYAINHIIKFCEYDKLFTIDKKYCSTAHITRTKGKKLSDNCCSLCLENHDIKHMIRTSCGHYFGKSCFAEFVKHCFYEDKDKFKCPNCRCDEFSIQQFKYKK